MAYLKKLSDFCFEYFLGKLFFGGSFYLYKSRHNSIRK